MPFHAPSRRRDWIQPAGSSGRTRSAHAGENIAKTVGERLADGEDHLKDADDHHEKQQRSPDAMEQNVIDLAAVFRRKRCAIAGAAADLGSPGVRAGRIAQHRQRQAAWRALVRRAD